MGVDAATDVDGTSDDSGVVAGDGSKGGVWVGGTAGVDLADVEDPESVDFEDTDGFKVGVDAAELEDGVIGCKRCLGDGLCDLKKVQ